MNQMQLFADREVVDVLVVDTDSSVADLIRRRLRRVSPAGFLVGSAPTVDDARHEIAALSPDVLVLGVAVDDPLSVDRLGRLRRIAHEIPIVVVHHAGDLDSTFDTVVTGAHDVLPLAEATGARLARVLRAAIERSRVEQAALAAASADAVTGLGSRWWITERLDRAVEHAADAGAGWQVAVLFIDLDRFKLVNDTLGHAAGDDLLRMVAERLRAAVRADDPVARFGGDEFVVLLEGHRIDGLAQRLALRLLAAFATPFRIDGHQFSVFASIGLAVLEPGEDAAALLGHADAACYRAKRRGRNRMVVYDDAMREWAEHQLGVAEAFGTVLDEGRLDLQWWTLVDLRRLEVVGRSVAAHWPDAPRGETTLGVATRAGLGPALGKWLLRAAVQGVRLAPWQRLLVELPSGLVAQPGFAAWIDEQLLDSPLDASQIVLLVEESEFDEPELIGPSLEALAERGVGVGLDRFGEGASSLTLMASSKVDEVRLSPGLVRRVVDEPGAAATMSGLVHLADAVGQQLLAAGVTDVVVARRLAQLGVHTVEASVRVVDALVGPGSDGGDGDEHLISLVDVDHPAVTGGDRVLR